MRLVFEFFMGFNDFKTQKVYLLWSMPYYSASAQYWYRVKKVGVVPARSRKSSIVQAVPQVVFTDVLIVDRLDVDGQSFAPIGLHKIDAASDWLLIKRHCIGTKDLPGVQLQN